MEFACKLLSLNVRVFSWRSCSSTLVFRRNLMASRMLSGSERAVEELKKNPYFEKYAGKIAALQQTSPEEFLERVEHREEEKVQVKMANLNDRKYSTLLEAKKKLETNAEGHEAQLEKIMKVELIQDKDVKEIEKIWKDYHLEKSFIAATIPSADYDEISRRAKEHPTFLFPIPRSEGYEFIMCQFHCNTVHFTPLLHYQVHKENAPECLTLTHYTEFKDSKGIVLMRGEYDKNVINASEAQCLANQLQLYYRTNDPSKLEILERFTKKPDEFKHMELIKQIENITLT